MTSHRQPLQPEKEKQLQSWLRQQPESQLLRELIHARVAELEVEISKLALKSVREKDKSFMDDASLKAEEANEFLVCLKVLDKILEGQNFTTAVTPDTSVSGLEDQ